jgi:hypothetical protein
MTGWLQIGGSEIAPTKYSLKRLQKFEGMTEWPRSRAEMYLHPIAKTWRKLLSANVFVISVLGGHGRERW